MPTTTERLAELRRLLAAATRGPFVCHEWKRELQLPDGTWVMSFRREEDAAFDTAIRDALPDLLNEIERLRRQHYWLLRGARFYLREVTAAGARELCDAIDAELGGNGDGRCDD